MTAETGWERARVAGLIDHTLLAPTATRSDVARLCAEAIARGFRGVCVAGSHLADAVKQLEGSQVKPITVVGFPLGHSTIYAKLFEALEGLRLGAEELDVVINISRLKSGDARAVESEMREIMAKTPECDHKFIVELALLEPAELLRVCKIANKLKPAYIKTATGFLAGPTTAEQVARLRSELDPRVAIKAAGGLKTWDDVRAVLEAGAAIVGTSSGVAILDQLPMD